MIERYCKQYEDISQMFTANSFGNAVLISSVSEEVLSNAHY